MSKTKFFVLAFLTVAGMSLGAIWLFEYVAGDKPYAGELEPKRSRVEIEDACQKHVSDAEVKAAAAIKRRASEFSEFIETRKSGAKPFSKDVVSWYGKWRVVKPALAPKALWEQYKTYRELTNPFEIIEKKVWGEKTNVEKIANGEALFDTSTHKKYVSEKFGEHIFSNEELAQALRRCIDGAIKDIEAIENELAVALRGEILGRSLKPDEVPIAAEKFRTVLERLFTASQWDAAKTVGSLVVSEVSAHVGTQVLVRLGVSAGILGTGAANSCWTLGAALVIGVVVDVIWTWIDDPAGDIEQEMASALDKLSLDASKAINDEMNKIITQRADLWNKTLTEILP